MSILAMRRWNWRQIARDVICAAVWIVTALYAATLWVVPQ